MKYAELREFIQNKMRMSHIYQPVMLMTLLRKGGACSQREIAKSLLLRDDSQIEYYEAITANMVGKVLRNRNVVALDKATKTYSLLGFESLSEDQIAELESLCKQKLSAFLDKRGDTVFDHRRISPGYISGTIKYEVLKRARFRCELCGISAEIKALEVDHIEPRNKQGIDDISNYQALCFSCNAMKRDRDNTDFRGMARSYEQRQAGCIFCEMKSDFVVDQNELAYVVRDNFPVSEHHSLIIPRRHVASYFDLGQAEVNAVTMLANRAKDNIGRIDASVAGFNMGVNSGEVAGQTIFHCHIHLIPRRAGDVTNPRGGVRHVIPGKGVY